MDTPADDPLNDIPIAPVPATGKVPDERVKDAECLRQIFTRFKSADEGSARNRTLVQGMFDGDPPYDDKELRDSGQPYRTNLNFGEAEAQLEYAMAGYTDLTQSVENLISVKTNFGNENERPEWEAAIAEEFTRTVRAWPQFHFNTLHLCHHFIAHGLGVGYWEDSTDWHYRGGGLDDFLFPRQTLATEDDLEIALARRSMPSWHLYQKIKNPETAEAGGWNVKATRKALSHATSNSTDSDDWMKLEAEFKNNDLGISAQHSEVKLVHAWVREFDDTICHYIITENDCGENEFLYKKRKAFKSMQEVFILFPFGLGTNALTHGIRGLGHKIFPMINASNRLRSDAMDSSRLAGSIMVKPADEESLNDIALTSFGPYTVLNPNVSIEAPSFPNLTQTLTPVLADMENLLARRAGAYNTQSAIQGGERKTRFEVAAQLEQASRLSNTSMELFYAPLERLFRQTIKRMARRSYLPIEPGGREVADMKIRLVKRGVPLDAFYQLDFAEVKAVRAIGAGSAAARTMQLAALEDIAPGYDVEGQHNLRRDRTIAAVGLAQADRYIPRKPDQRPPIDTKIAFLENNQLIEGILIPVMPNENHVIHVEVHLVKLNEFYMAANEGTLPLEEAAPMMLPVFNHTAEHLALIGGDPLTLQKAADFRQALQQIGEVITNGMKKLEAAQRQQIEANEAGAQERGNIPQQGPSIDDQIKFEKHVADMRHRDELHELKKAEMIQDAAIKRNEADVKNANVLTRFL